jgi:hypothetical protein
MRQMNVIFMLMMYAMSKDSSDDRQHKKAKKSVPTKLTPVTIMDPESY